MSTYRVPKCGRHFVKFDDVTIYPVLVVARTAIGQAVSEIFILILIFVFVFCFSLILLRVVCRGVRRGSPWTGL